MPGISLQLIQRGNNRQACFFSDEGRHAYLTCRDDYARSNAYQDHAYVLMTDHLHLRISSADDTGPGRLVKALRQRSVRSVNRRCRHSGTLCEGRFRSCLLADERYLHACQRSIELNPMCARIVGDPAAYRWSSHRGHAQGEAAPVIQSHCRYQALGAGFRWISGMELAQRTKWM